MSIQAPISVAFLVFAVSVLPAKGATIRAQQAAAEAGSGNASISGSERASDPATAARTEGDATFGGAAYTPFVETTAKPARVELHASADRNAQEADLTLSALAALAAIGALVYLVRRAWYA